MTSLDMSGARVTSDKPVMVFAGHEEGVVCYDGATTENCCADHMEEQLTASHLGGTQFISVKSPVRGPTDKDVWRVQALVPGVVLATNPAIPGVNGQVLSSAGEWVEFAWDGDFVLTSSLPVQLMQYLVGRECAGSTLGDPSMVFTVPLERAGTFFVAAPFGGLAEETVTLVRPAGGSVQVTGAILDDAGWDAIGSGSFEKQIVDLTGMMEIVCSPYCMAYAYGYGPSTSYGHPLGGQY